MWQRFVEYVLQRSKLDSGFAAKMRRADNPDTEDQSWGLLAAFGVNLEREQERLPYALIGAALCRADIDRDGDNGIGVALASCFDGASARDLEKPGASRLRRLLACASTKEACQILRPLLRLVDSKSRKPLCYARLLRELLFFERDGGEQAKVRWAMDFYTEKSA